MTSHEGLSSSHAVLGTVSGSDTALASRQAFTQLPNVPSLTPRSFRSHRLSLGLRAELPASVWNEQILSVERSYPRSLVHPG